MYKRANRFINSDRFGAFVGTGLEVKARPCSTPSRPRDKPANKNKITIEERYQLGLGHADETEFLDRVQAALNIMMRNGVQTSAAQATRLNNLGIFPYQGRWNARLVAMFFKRQGECNAARSKLERNTQIRGQQAVKGGTKGAVRRTDLVPDNPIVSPELARLLKILQQVPKRSRKS